MTDTMTFFDTYGYEVARSPESGWTRGGISAGPMPADAAATVFAGMDPRPPSDAPDALTAGDAGSIGGAGTTVRGNL